MGNYLSCTLTLLGSPRSGGGGGGSGGGGAPRLILPNGVTKTFDTHTTVAELMFELPDHFVVDVAAVHVGKRLSPLPADAELDLGGVYAMIPMRRLSSVATPEYVAGLLVAATGGTPVNVAEEETMAPEKGKLLDQNVAKMDEEVELRYRTMVHKCRSKKPLLETIAEENAALVFSR